jgi:hypothetical protein
MVAEGLSSSEKLLALHEKGVYVYQDKPGVG